MKLLYLFIPLLFISCSGDDNEITFLEKYDGVMFQSEFCPKYGGCENTITQWNYISFHNENVFIKQATSIGSTDLICIQTINGTSAESVFDIEYEKKTDITINLFDELKIKTTRRNLISQEIDSWFTQYLVKGDSLSVEIQSSTGGSFDDIATNFYGKLYKSLTTYKDLCE